MTTLRHLTLSCSWHDLALALGLSLALVGCSSSSKPVADAAAGDSITGSDAPLIHDPDVDASGSDGGNGDSDSVVDRCEVVGERSCVAAENAWRRCEANVEGNRWSAPVACEAGSYCRAVNGECLPPTMTQQQQAGWLGAMVDHIGQTIGWIADLPLDLDATRAEVKQILFGGDESDRAYYTAARAGLLGFPIGHLQMWSNNACGTDALPWQEASYLGACARPYQNGSELIITLARLNNPLGLKVGDRITAIAGLTGEAMVDFVLRQPMCGTSSASEANRRMVAATSALGVLPKGTALTVVSPDGSERLAIINSFALEEISCRDPFGRDPLLVADATLRPDGVGVIRLTRFTPLDGFKGTTMEELQAEMAALQAEIAAELDKLAGAQGIVWDLRGNIGGATPVGLAIVGGMPSAKQTFIAHCKSRIPQSEPPQFYGGESQFDYVVEVNPKFVHPNKVAVVIDGLAISAADYFAYAVSRATSVALVGSPTAGAFGGGGTPVPVSTDPDLIVQSDPARCADEADIALEGRAVQPTHPVEYTPADLAAGKDSLLEAAAALVRPSS